MILKSKAGKRILSTALAAVMALGLAVSPPLTQTANAAPPTPGVGDANDGLDISGLFAAGNHIYYGTYDHAKTLASGSFGTVTAREDKVRPILWRVMGEEGSEGTVTLLSEYVLDSQMFNTSYYGGNAQNYGDTTQSVSSEIRTWLNSTFLSSFATAEQGGLATVHTTTGMYNYSGGAAITGDHYPQYAYTDDGQHLNDNNTAQTVNTGPWPKTTTDDKVYIPWGTYHNDKAYWTAGNAAGIALADNKAYLRSDTSKATAMYWWLRSPDSYSSDSALAVHPSGDVYSDYVSDAGGVRPAFKLNPSSVIFTSEILSDVTGRADATLADGANYFAGEAGAKNYKLTVVDSLLSLTGLNAGGIDITTTSSFTRAPGDSIPLSGTGNGDVLAYKIVKNSDRTLAGYGTGTASEITVAAKDLAGTYLADGNYTVYIWTQKNEAINSHRGSTPQYFTMTVQTGAKIVTGITLDETTINLTSSGTQTLTPTITPSYAAVTTVTWSSSNTGVATVDNTGKVTGVTKGTATIIATANDGTGVTATCTVTVNNPPTAKATVPTQEAVISTHVTVSPTFTAADIAEDLDSDTLEITAIVTEPDNQYATASLSSGTVTITGVAAGTTNVVVTVSDGMATVHVTVPIVVYDEPLVPSVYPASVTVYKGESKTVYAFFGQNADEATSATVTSGDAAIAFASPTDVTTTGSAITIEGVSAGTTTVTLGWSGGAQNGTTSTVNVTVENRTYTVIASAGTGGTVSGGGSFVDGTNCTLTATANSGYEFVNWTEGGTEVSTSASYTFTVTGNRTLMANFKVKSGGGTNPPPSGGDRDTSSNAPVTPAKPVITDKQPNMPTTAKTSVTGTITNKVLTVSITEQMVKDAIKVAQEAAKASGKTADGIAVQFDVSNTTGYDSIVVKYDREAIQALKDAGVKFVMIGSDIIDLSLDAKAIDSILAQTTGVVTVSAIKQTKISNPAKTAIGVRPVFDITIKGANGAVVSDLKGGFATIGIAYKTANNGTGSLWAVYVKPNGQIEWLKDSSYTNNRLIFKRGTLSVYGVGYNAPTIKFTDTATHWAREDIEFAVSRGMLSGTNGTAFSPDTSITRATFLMALGKLSAADVSGYKTSSFSDVTATSAAMPYIEWAYQNGIVKGIGDGKFGPEQFISRQDMTVMMVNYAKATGYKLPTSRTVVTFADEASITAYAKDAVKAIQQAGIMQGKDANKFDPQGKTTRAEASAILRRFVELVIDEGTARGWNKNESGHWTYIRETGKAVTGWLTVGDSKYYFDASGVMVSGKWLEIESKWYYFQADGKLAVNTKIDGYTVDKDGVRQAK